MLYNMFCIFIGVTFANLGRERTFAERRETANPSGKSKWLRLYTHAQKAARVPWRLLFLLFLLCIRKKTSYTLIIVILIITVAIIRVTSVRRLSATIRALRPATIVPAVHIIIISSNTLRKTSNNIT